MAAVKRIFLYLRGTIDLQLTFRGELTDLVGYSDCDWGGDLLTHKSTAGFVFNIGMVYKLVLKTTIHHCPINL